jgi:hypothetical protein
MKKYLIIVFLAVSGVVATKSSSPGYGGNGSRNIEVAGGFGIGSSQTLAGGEAKGGVRSGSVVILAGGSTIKGGGVKGGGVAGNSIVKA